MQRTPADFSDALAGIDQDMLDGVSELGPVRRMASAAFLKIGALHGVTVEIEAPLGQEGDVPPLVRQGLVIRCMLPRGIALPRLAGALAEGPVAELVRKVLDGHRLRLTAEGGAGSLTPAAEQARSRLLEALSGMALAPVPAPVPAKAAPRPWRRQAALHLAAA